MTWGEKHEGGVIDFPALLYTQRLAQSQVAGSDEAATSVDDFMAAQAAVADIVADQCPRSSRATAGEESKYDEEEDEDDEEEEEEVRQNVCCGREAPDWCLFPEHLHLRLRHYYPAITFFVQEDGRELKKLAV